MRRNRGPARQCGIASMFRTRVFVSSAAGTAARFHAIALGWELEQHI